ncbi:hypothetical protein OQA88_1577 [Cercophora sp. LCS_1]
MDATGDTLSFGLEFEFIIYWKPAAFSVEQGKVNFPATLLGDILLANGIPVAGRPLPPTTPNPFPGLYLEQSGWDVGFDSTVSEAMMAMFDIRARLPDWDWDWAPIELRTPVLRFSPAALAHVAAVVSTITRERRQFRVRVNPTCGLHCHVGAGVELANNSKAREHAAWVLRRVAQLVWAADGFLCHLHPPERAFTRFSESVRVFANVVFAEVNARNGGWSEGSDEPERFTDALPPRARQGQQRFPALRPETCALEGIDRLNRAGVTYNSGENARSMARRTTITQGVDLLDLCQTSDQVAEMMEKREDLGGLMRLNYSFHNYTSEQRMWPSFTGTVKFREAAGSLDAEWVVAWAKICVGIFEFAKTVSEDRFRLVLTRLVRAESVAIGGGRNDYDVVHFLHDIGCEGAAGVVERRLGTEEEAMRLWFPCDIDFRGPRPIFL